MKHGSRQRHIESLKRKIEDLERRLADADARASRIARLYHWVIAFLEPVPQDDRKIDLDLLWIIAGQAFEIIQAKAMPPWKGQKDG